MEILTELIRNIKLSDIFFKLGKRGILSEKDIDTVLREIRIALLEADVGFKVVSRLHKI